MYKRQELANESHGGGSGSEEDSHGESHNEPHMPDPSYYPLFLGLGMSIMIGGFIPFTGHWIVCGVGLAIFIWSFLGWCYEPVND